ncbi:MAG: ABC transporter ATP-binding protein [Defluviitaleaceae bacterium]|nr:ABC transporter ATP-binding protein [Defluviitaleaceae bacterium]
MLSVTDIHKSYKNTPVLSGVSLSAERGLAVGIAGANGSGKSTLLSILCGLLAPDAGEALLDGANVQKDPRARRRIGLVPQESALYDDLSVRDNINFWASAYKVKYEPWLMTADDMPKKARVLSGGMRKRLNIELAMINAPDFLVLDEPASGLDLVYQLQVSEIISRLKAEGRGVILTSHNADELWVCDTLYILKAGGFVYSGAPDGFSDKESFRNRLYETISG